jgi:hypothetical protein
MIGINYVGHHRGVDMKKTVEEYNEENDDFMVELLNGESEHVTYNQMLDVYNREEDPEEKLWTFNEITNHQTYRGKQQVEVLEPVAVIKDSDLLTLARYAQDNDLTDLRGWKWAKMMAMIWDCIIRMIYKKHHAFGRAFVVKGKTKKKQGPKYKFGV